MIAGRFRAVGSVAGVAAAALGCYLVSLQVAAERGQLMKTERRIVAARADIRQLRTELETRGRLVQLERWNREVLGLQAPQVTQYAAGAVQLAGYVAPHALPQVVPAVAPAPAPAAPAIQQVAARPAPPVTAPAAEAPMLRHATFAKPPAEPQVQKAALAAPPRPAPLLQKASYSPPPPAVAAKDALLGDALLGDIGRAAAREAKAR